MVQQYSNNVTHIIRSDDMTIKELISLKTSSREVIADVHQNASSGMHSYDSHKLYCSLLRAFEETLGFQFTESIDTMYNNGVPGIPITDYSREIHAPQYLVDLRKTPKTWDDFRSTGRRDFIMSAQNNMSRFKIDSAVNAEVLGNVFDNVVNKVKPKPGRNPGLR